MLSSQEMSGQSDTAIELELDHDAGSAATAPRSAPERVVAKTAIACFSVGLLALTLAPIRQHWSEAPVDGFPFSYYPMFAQRFGLAVVVGTAVAAVMALWVFPGLLGEAREATRSAAET